MGPDWPVKKPLLKHLSSYSLSLFGAENKAIGTVYRQQKKLIKKVWWGKKPGKYKDQVIEKINICFIMTMS